MLTKINILESIAYVISELIFLGGREITLDGGDILEIV